MLFQKMYFITSADLHTQKNKMKYNIIIASKTRATHLREKQ